MRRFRNVLRHWLQSALVIVAMCALIYLVAQQSFRWNADDPQVQMAEDGALALGKGAEPATLAPQTSVEISQSLAPFIMVVDDTGRVVFSSGTLYGKQPSLPLGVLEYTRKYSEDRLTWAPDAAVRIAAIVRRVDGNTPGFIVVGRSLREVESRIDKMSQIVIVVTALTLAASLVICFLTEGILRHSRHHRSTHSGEEEEV